MKTTTFLPLCTLGLFSLSGVTALAADEAKPAPAKEKWELVWSEEFNTVNDKPAKPDPKKWTIETEFVRNIKAKQLYTDRAKNVVVSNGNLVLTAYAEKRKNGNYDPSSSSWLKNREFADFTSGSINSDGKFEFMYGKVEMRARIEHGKGVWPALWLIGKNIRKVSWPKCGEIDILEYVSQDKDFLHCTFHWQEGNDTGFTKKTEAKDILQGYHTYGMVWDSKKIDITFDGKVLHTLDLAKADIGDYNAFRQPFYFIINLALGGWAEDPDPKAYPRRFMVDYVRVYQDANNPESELYIGGKKVDRKTAAKK